MTLTINDVVKRSKVQSDASLVDNLFELFRPLQVSHYSQWRLDWLPGYLIKNVNESILASDVEQSFKQMTRIKWVQESSTQI